MSTEIPALRAGLSPAVQARPELAAVARPAAAAEAVAKPDAALEPIKRAEVKFDPDQMRKNLEEIVQRMNDQMKQTNRNLAFSIDDVANRYVISVKHSATGELIRQIPDESILRVAHSIEKLRGLLADHKI